MGRKVKCKICGNQIEQVNAYKVEHITSSGNKQNQYYCSEKEYLEDKKEKEYYKECQYLLDNIFGEIIVDNTRNKKLSELKQAGYSYETIYTCINEISKKIEDALVIKREDFNCKNGMYMKIAYCFGIIKKEIVNYDHKGKDKKINGDVLNPNEVYKNNRKVKHEKRSIMDIVRGESNGK